MHCICMGFYDANLFAIQETFTIHSPWDVVWYNYFSSKETRRSWYFDLKVSLMFFIKIKFLPRYLILLLCFFFLLSLKPLKLKTSLAEYNSMWSFCATYPNPNFYRNSVFVCVCTHISGLAPPPTQPFCLQARPLSTGSSCFPRLQIRAANQSRV